jgi:hypothetical protein
MKILLIAAAALGLSACVSTQERVAQAAQLCASFGYPPGSQAMSDCEQQQYALALEHRRQAAAAFMTGMGGAARSLQQPITGGPATQPAPKSITTTQCQPNGDGMSCTTN